MAERPPFVCQRKRPLKVAAVVVQLDLGPGGVLSWCMPSYRSEAGRRHSAVLAREKELNVGHFLRLPVAQCGGWGQGGAGVGGHGLGAASLQGRVSSWHGG